MMRGRVVLTRTWISGFACRKRTKLTRLHAQHTHRSALDATRSALGMLLALSSALCACNSLLGIEDLKLKPDAGSLATAQREQDPDSGVDHLVADSGKPDRATNPAPGAAAAGGASATSTSNPTRSAAAGSNSTPAAGSGAPPTATKQTADTAAKTPITGTLIDYRMRRLPGVSVRVGNQQTTSDANGGFTLPDIPARYDITLHIQTVISGGTVSLVWQFQGLSRRNPTLQVYRGLPERDAEVRVKVDNVTFPLAADETVLVAWSSPDGDFALDTDSPELDFLSPSWTGPAMSEGVAHALWLKKTGDLPSTFLGYGVQHLVMSADTKAMLTLDLGGDKPTAAAVSGKVTGHVIGDRRNELYLRFAGDDSALQLVDQLNVTDDFSYMTPNIPGATATVVAKAVAAPGGVAAAYADAQTTALQLDLPPLPVLAVPDDAKTNVDRSTMFQWTSDAHIVVLCARAVNTYDAIYVVTEAKQSQLPIGADFGYAPPANAPFEWSVQTHDAYANIDAAASEQGFLSAYATGQIRATRRGAGHFAQSVTRVFTTAP